MEANKAGHGHAAPHQNAAAHCTSKADGVSYASRRGRASSRWRWWWRRRRAACPSLTSRTRRPLGQHAEALSRSRVRPREAGQPRLRSRRGSGGRSIGGGLTSVVGIRRDRKPWVVHGVRERRAARKGAGHAGETPTLFASAYTAPARATGARFEIRRSERGALSGSDASCPSQTVIRHTKLSCRRPAVPCRGGRT
jgi:hypothetical protein